MTSKNKKKPIEKNQPPLLDDFLNYQTRRKDFKWSKDEEGLVHIKIPKFKGNLGRSFTKALRKEDYFTADMDKIGSIVWILSDEEHTVEDILMALKEEFPDEADKEGNQSLEQRLAAFIQQMVHLEYMEIYIPNPAGDDNDDDGGGDEGE